MTLWTKLRLDHLLVERGSYNSRARARDAILRGAVWVDGAKAVKPGQSVAADACIALDDEALGFVSRAALKLKHALNCLEIDLTGKVAVDIGASTGGFVQVMLQAGAAHVYAVDVGKGQIAPALARDPRVTSLEGRNARDLTRDHIPRLFQIVTSDVSFISLKLALPPALVLADPGAQLIGLIKPQFEAGRTALGKGGIVRDASVHRTVCDDISQWLERDQEWRVTGLIPSPIDGGDGNREFIIAAQKP